ncbi:hypothetical protein N7G274_002450 [Stereocaulon virgatum]|uniref:Uncharacterized protein n=1 Tax=Stereocaulon virgatum TaxID=373712 RepID=A0ABR4AIJ9_9LECA
MTARCWFCHMRPWLDSNQLQRWRTEGPEELNTYAKDWKNLLWWNDLRMHLFHVDMELQPCDDLLVRGTELLTARIWPFSAQIQSCSFRTLAFQLEDLVIVIEKTWDVAGALYYTHPLSADYLGGMDANTS